MCRDFVDSGACSSTTPPSDRPATQGEDDADGRSPTSGSGACRSPFAHCFAFINRCCPRIQRWFGDILTESVLEAVPPSVLRRHYYLRVPQRNQMIQVDVLQHNQMTQVGGIVLCPTCGDEGSPDSETQRCPECSALGATVGNMAYALSMAPRSDSDGERSRSGWTVASGLETAENVDGTFDQALQTRSVFENMRWDSTKKSFYLPVGASESSWGWHKKDVGPDPQMPDVSPCPYGQRCSYLRKCRRHHPVQWTKSLGYEGPCPFGEECWYLRKCRRYHPPDSNRCDDKSCFQWSFDGSCARSEERRVGKECRSRRSPYH